MIHIKSLQLLHIFYAFIMHLIWFSFVPIRKLHYRVLYYKCTSTTKNVPLGIYVQRAGSLCADWADFRGGAVGKSAAHWPHGGDGRQRVRERRALAALPQLYHRPLGDRRRGRRHGRGDSRRRDPRRVQRVMRFVRQHCTTIQNAWEIVYLNWWIWYIPAFHT